MPDPSDFDARVEKAARALYSVASNPVSPGWHRDRYQALEMAARNLVAADSVLHVSAPPEAWERYTAAIVRLREVLNMGGEG